MGKHQRSPKILKPTKRALISKGRNTAGSRILGALASYRASGQSQPERKKIQGMAAMTNKHSFDTTLLNMRNKGFLKYDTTSVWLTDKGIEAVGGVEACAPPSDNSGM